MEGPVVAAAERYDEFVAYFAAERPLLGETDVVRVDRTTAANETRLGSHELEVGLVAVATWLANRQGTFINSSPTCCRVLSRDNAITGQFRRSGFDPSAGRDARASICPGPIGLLLGALGGCEVKCKG